MSSRLAAPEKKVHAHVRGKFNLFKDIGSSISPEDALRFYAIFIDQVSRITLREI